MVVVVVMAAALNQEWGSCMSRRGYDFEYPGPASAFDLALRTRPDGTVGPLPTPGAQAADIPAEEQSLLGIEPEREIALADFDCRVQTGYLERLTEMRVRADEEFIQANRAQLDQLVAASPGW
jgi:hypothetical protein